jgi:exopolysaccharide biosynthesis polyprenyl glycosylphosphotransferase
MLKRKKINLVMLASCAILLDILSVIAADITSFLVRYNGLLPERNFSAYLRLALFIVILRIIGFYMFRFYDGAKNKTGFEVFVNSVKACATSSLIIITVLYYLNIEAYPRSIASLSFITTILFVNTWRVVVKNLAWWIFGHDIFHSRLLIIGTGEAANELAMKALMNASAHYRLLGFVDTGKGEPAAVEKEKMLGSLDELPFLVKKYAVDEVIVADNSLNERKISDLMSLLSWEGIALRAAPPAYEMVINNMVLYESGVPFLGPTFASRPIPPWYWGLKRICDIFFGAFLLVLTFPVALVAAILIKATSPGPLFYLQKRTGLNGKPFIMYKFRTMQMNAERGNKPRWAALRDARVTTVGKYLRHFRIDELPQLVNVLRNEMSIIGPRPERPYFTSKLMWKIPFYAQRLQAKPGLSGWAQVSYQYTDTEKGAREKLLYDLFYIHNASLALDFLIVLKTFRVILTGHGAH